MVSYQATAEYGTLEAVRVHQPGIETFVGAVDYDTNHFLQPFSLAEAQREHQTLVETLQGEGVEVHQLHEELASTTALEQLVEQSVTATETDERVETAPVAEEIRANLNKMTSYERLQAVLMNLNVTRTDGTAITDTAALIENAVTNIYFQRDSQLVTDRGPVVCHPYTEIRRREKPLVTAAWQSLDVDPMYEAGPEPLEGGDFLPLAEFALLAVSAIEDGTETVLRTSYDAGKRLLDSDALGFDEVGLIRAPLETDRRLAAAHGTSFRLMHLDGWVNVPAEGIAVVREDLAAEATVEVFARDGDGYRADREVSSLISYLRQHDYEVIDAPYPERWATNFLTIDDGVVMPIYESNDGTYDPAANRTIEAMKDEGIEVVPDGTGLYPDQLTNGGGGIHCMTSPVRRS